jgi:hypothetical protein
MKYKIKYTLLFYLWKNKNENFTYFFLENNYQSTIQ